MINKIIIDRMDGCFELLTKQEAGREVFMMLNGERLSVDEVIGR
jgi:hypothetical protein